LSDSERSIKAQAEFEKAMIHLIEAERLAEWGNAPNACIHSADYDLVRGANNRDAAATTAEARRSSMLA
jgi:hypothetical protein